MNDSHRMRIGIALPGGILAQWLLELVQSLQSARACDVVLVHLPETPTLRANFAAKLLRLVELKLPDIEEDVLQQTAIPADWNQCHNLRVDSWKSFASTVDDNAIDILISTDPPPLDDEPWPQRSRCWFPQFSSLPGSVAGFDEVRWRHDSLNVVLQEASHSGDRAVDACTTRPDRISTLRTRNLMYRRVATFIRRAIARESVQEVPNASLAQRSQLISYQQIPATLPASEMLLRLAFRVVSAQILNLVKPETWFLAWSTDDPIEFARSRDENTIYGPAGRIWADPFVHDQDGNAWVFFEDAPPHENTGFIAAGRLDKKNNGLLETKPALIRPYHLSYPMLFEYQGVLHMLPESSQNRSIEAYRCVTFPHHWELAAVLMAGVIAVDSTLYEHQGLWYLFTSIRDQADDPSDDELHLYTSNSPLSNQWAPHPLNPIVCGVDRSRCAGSLFHEGDKLYRPAQDCSGTYGRAVRVMEVTALSASDYEEREVIDMAPSLGQQGIHTLNAIPGTTVVDHKARTWRWSNKFG